MKIITKKNALFSLLILGLLLSLAIFIVTKINASTTRVSVKILEREFSICTANVPPSSCGPYDISVVTEDGTRSQYQVPGFEESDDNSTYYKINDEVNEAIEKGTSVTLQINKKKEIVSID